MFQLNHKVIKFQTERLERYLSETSSQLLIDRNTLNVGTVW